jgi:hypothetical protein
LYVPVGLVELTYATAELVSMVTRT